jgi:hypothetical protein
MILFIPKEQSSGDGKSLYKEIHGLYTEYSIIKIIVPRVLDRVNYIGPIQSFFDGFLIQFQIHRNMLLFLAIPDLDAEGR